MALGKGMESLVHLVRTMPRRKSSSSSSSSSGDDTQPPPHPLATLHLLHSALPHGCVEAPAPSEPRCVALFRSGRFLHEHVIWGLNRAVAGTCHHHHHHHHPNEEEEGIISLKAQVLLEAFHILFLRASSSSGGTGRADVDGATLTLTPNP